MNDMRRGISLKSILYVDGDADSRDLMRSILAEYRVVFATNAYEAIRDLNNENEVFHAYVLDQWLPDLSGIQLCREIRKVDRHGPVFFCTGAARDADRARAMRAGASVYLCKPIDPAQFLDELRARLELDDEQSLCAKREEQRAIREELERRTAAAMHMTNVARDAAAKAIERTARIKAFHAFVESGGTRANFATWWPQVFASAWATCDIGAANSAAAAEAPS